MHIVLDKNFKLLYLMIRLEDFVEVGLQRCLCITRITKKLLNFSIQGRVTKSGTKQPYFVHFVLIVLDQNFKLLYLMIRLEDFVELGPQGYLCIKRISEKFSNFSIQGEVTKIGNITYLYCTLCAYST
jgi:hypothetical protein